MPPDHDHFNGNVDFNGSVDLNDAESVIPRSGRPQAVGRPPAAGELTWHALSADQVLHSEGVDGQRGLSSAEAAAWAQRFGPNELAAGKAEPRSHVLTGSSNTKPSDATLRTSARTCTARRRQVRLRLRGPHQAVLQCAHLENHPFCSPSPGCLGGIQLRHSTWTDRLGTPITSPGLTTVTPWAEISGAAVSMTFDHSAP